MDRSRGKAEMHIRSHAFPTCGTSPAFIGIAGMLLKPPVGLLADWAALVSQTASSGSMSSKILSWPSILLPGHARARGFGGPRATEEWYWNLEPSMMIPGGLSSVE